jgi:hypothetical protein
MEFFALAVLLMTLLASADRAPAVPEDSPAYESISTVQAIAPVDGTDRLAVLPACTSDVLYRNLLVPAKQAVYWQADGQRCDPEGPR